MSTLAEVVAVAPRDVRAVDVEADAQRTEPLNGYVVSAHVLDALRQITIGWQGGPRTRAWSVTGPYGAGKSAFVHLLQALHAAPDAAIAGRATDILGEADAQLASTLASEIERADGGGRGFILALVRAHREPAADAITRALTIGATRYWAGRRAPQIVQELCGVRDVGLASEGAGEVVLEWVRRLTRSAPILLVVDELGQVLEHAHSRSDESDLFVLQQLAEWFSGQDECRGGLLTLQHLAYEDYLAGVNESRRREWRKVQGRFADLPFVADAAHGHRLLARALSLRPEASSRLRPTIARAAEQAESQLQELAGDVMLPSATTGDPAATYPLHPTAATALPDLAARYGQHDRTLVAFLAGGSPSALPAVLAATQVAATDVPFVRLSQLYDAVIADPQAGHAPGRDGARLREVRSRLEDQPGLCGVDLEVSKTVAVLNLIAARRGLRADVGVIETACCGPANDPQRVQEVRDALDRLVATGVIVWRQFADEYRVWRGSDVDLEAVVAVERERLVTRADATTEIALLASARPLRAPVAQRHSLQHHVLRFFEARYASAIPVEPRCHIDGADGLVLYVIADQPVPAHAPKQTVDGRPLVVVYTPHGREPLDAVLDAAAVKEAVEGSEELQEDPVARREARYRAAKARDAVAVRLDGALDPRRDGVCWIVAGEARPAGGTAALSRCLSELCDERYELAPILRSEMLNRTELTSQGAKARGELLRAMFESGDQADLAFTGHGPEASMYRAVLQATGVHSVRDGRLSFGAPRARSGLRDVWTAISHFFDAATDAPRPLSELWQMLAEPPYGMKDGPIPVLIAAALLAREDDVFLYQDGTFVSVVGSADVERLVKAPERYAVKRAAMLGLRAAVFRELRDTLIARAARVAGRNATTLVVVRSLLAHLHALPGYTRQTSQLSERAIAVRDALASAREPDELLFTALPLACGVPAFAVEAPVDADVAQRFVAELRAALRELSSAYERLLVRVEGLLRSALRIPKAQRSVREALRVRSAHLVDRVIDPRARGFLATASDDASEDREWLEAVALNVAVKPMTVWSDQDVDLFEAALAERASWFLRLEVLHADQRPQGLGAFTTRLVTVTAPDGRDTKRLVAIDEQARKVLTAALDTVLESLRTSGEHPEDALIALLGERMLDAETKGERSAPQLRKVG